MKMITDGIFYTGVLNPNMRVFDIIMCTEYGTSYNSYFVAGSEKTAIIEAAHLSFYDNYLANIEQAAGSRGIDYLVLNHCEPDHTGCVAKILERFPDIEVVVSQAGSIYIKQISNRPDLKIRVVKDGDSISLGDKTLSFINAPFLHWPDSMFTYVPESKVLFSCDFLGAHYCEPQVLDTHITYMDAYRKAMQYYYDCIFGPFAPHVLKGLDKIDGLEIDYACTSHGPVLSADGLLPEVMSSYRAWATPKPRAAKCVPVFYVSAYGNTRILAEAAAEGIKQAIPDAHAPVYNIIEHDMGELAAMLNESDGFILGSPTINRDALAPVWNLISCIDAVNIQKRPVALLGSYGWSGEALGFLEQRLSALKLKVFPTALKVNFVPTDADIDSAKALGAAFGKSIIEG